MSITIGPGIGIGHGITIGPNSGFTITSADFTQWYNGGGITAGGTDGFTNGGTQGPGWNFYGPNLGALNGAPNPNKLNELIAYWTANGLALDGNSSYIFNATWGLGSSPQSDKVVITLFPDANYAVLDIGPVSTATDAWQTGGQNIYNNGVLFSAQGTYNFPATFTLYTPLITNNSNWC